MPRQMDLPVAPDDAAVALDQYRGVVAPGLAPLLRQFGVTQIEPDPQFLRQIEERPGLRPWHLALEIVVDLGLIGHPPARKECRQRQFRKHDEGGAGRMRLAQHRHQPFDDRGAVVGEMDRPQLGDGGAEYAGHWVLLFRYQIEHGLPIVESLGEFRMELA
jgi:hypothetical protein